MEVLERAAFEGRPFDVGVVIIHSANPAGAAKMAQVAVRRGVDRGCHAPLRVVTLLHALGGGSCDGHQIVEP